MIKANKNKIRSKFNKYDCVLTLIFFAFMYNTGICQYGAPIPMTTTIKTPYGNVPVTTYIPGPRYYYGTPNVSMKYQFHIILKNDSTVVDRTRINIDKDQDNSLTVKHKGNKQVIFPKDTKFIYRMTGAGLQLAGIPADSCWLFKTIRGKINGYSFLAEEGMTYVIAIQQGSEGPIVPLTKENLLPMVSTDPKAVKLAEKDKLHRAITTFN